MIRKLLAVSFIFSFAIPFASAADTTQSKASNLSASEIVSKNVAARGGLQAWRSVNSLSWTGKMGVGGNQRFPVPRGTSRQKRSATSHRSSAK